MSTLPDASTRALVPGYSTEVVIGACRALRQRGSFGQGRTSWPSAPQAGTNPGGVGESFGLQILSESGACRFAGFAGFGDGAEAVGTWWQPRKRRSLTQQA